MNRFLEMLWAWWPKAPPPPLTEDEAQANLRLNEKDRKEIAKVENVAPIKPAPWEGSNNGPAA